jgi:hypothetical protein
MDEKKNSESGLIESAFRRQIALLQLGEKIISENSRTKYRKDV